MVSPVRGEIELDGGVVWRMRRTRQAEIERICRELRECFDPVPGDTAHVIANQLIDRNAEAAVAWRRRTDLSAGLPEARLGEG